MPPGRTRHIGVLSHIWPWSLCLSTNKNKIDRSKMTTHVGLWTQLYFKNNYEERTLCLYLVFIKILVIGENIILRTTFVYWGITVVRVVAWVVTIWPVVIIGLGYFFDKGFRLIYLTTWNCQDLSDCCVRLTCQFHVQTRPFKNPFLHHYHNEHGTLVWTVVELVQ